MYLWFEWCDDSIDPSRTLEFLNSYELWGHILTHETEEPGKRRDGCFYQALRNQGRKQFASTGAACWSCPRPTWPRSG